MKSVFIPRGVCSRRYTIELNDGVIEDITIEGGCNGNLSGISRLLKGQRAEDVIERLRGTTCGPRPTSCPDQIAIALTEALKQEKELQQ